MKSFVAIAVLIIMVTIGSSEVRAFNLIEVDLSPSLMGWCILKHDWGLPANQVIQVYGNPIDQWFIFATGPVVRIPIPCTKIDLELPVGLKLIKDGKRLSITHWVGKVNFIGEVGPLKLTSIHDMAWGRKGSDNEDVFFFKEIVSWRCIGLRAEGRKIGDEALPVFVGPMILHDFPGKHELQFFLGTNARNKTEEKLIISYILKF